jgi:integrase
MAAPPRTRHHEMAALSLDQARTLLDAAAGERLEALYVLTLTMGLRQGEPMALKWRDVDLAGATSHVRSTLQNISSE